MTVRLILILSLMALPLLGQVGTRFNPFTGKLDYIGLPNPFKSCADAGSTDDYACTLGPAISSYETGGWYWFKANTANTGAATLNFNSLGAKTIKKFTAASPGADLADNDIRAGQWVHVVYDGTNFQMLSAVGNAGGGSGDVTDVGDCTSGACFVAAGTGSVLTFIGSTSGSAQVGVADAAGTPARINLPTATGTANYFLRGNGATPQQTSWQPAPLHFAFGTNASVNPTDGSTTYTGCSAVAASSTVNINHCLVIRTGTITEACIQVSVLGVLGSGESGTASVRLNNTTDTTISAAVTYTAAAQTFCNSGLSIAVVQGDFFEFKLVHPTWATNPTTVRLYGAVLVY